MELRSYILYENNDLLVINKPAGIAVHGDGKHDTPTIAEALLHEYPELETIGEPLVVEHKGESIIVPRPGIVHRLDKDTTGVLLVAKTQQAFLFFKKQFQERTTEKVYFAYVYGWPKELKGVIKLPIGRAVGDIRKWSTGSNARGEMRDAVTEYEILKKCGGDTEDSLHKGSTEEGTFSYLRLIPKTGRTHQLRVHLKAINHPIVCDSLYAPTRSGGLGFTRLALHAYSLTITLPDGIKTTFTAPLPEDFMRAEGLA